MTTLRDILTADSQSVWENNAGDVYTMEGALEAWADDLDREASCVDGEIDFLDEHGYVEGGEPILREVSIGELQRRATARYEQHPRINSRDLEYCFVDDPRAIPHIVRFLMAPIEELIDEPKPKRLGRPRTNPEGMRPTWIFVTHEQRETLARLGNGNMNEGFRQVMKHFDESRLISE